MSSDQDVKLLNLYRDLIINQVAMSEEEREKIIQEHEKNLAALESRQGFPHQPRLTNFYSCFSCILTHLASVRLCHFHLLFQITGHRSHIPGFVNYCLPIRASYQMFLSWCLIFRNFVRQSSFQTLPGVRQDLTNTSCMSVDASDYGSFLIVIFFLLFLFLLV